MAGTYSRSDLSASKKQRLTESEATSEPSAPILLIQLPLVGVATARLEVSKGCIDATFKTIKPPVPITHSPADITTEALESVFYAFFPSGSRLAQTLAMTSELRAHIAGKLVTARHGVHDKLKHLHNDKKPAYKQEIVSIPLPHEAVLHGLVPGPIVPPPTASSQEPVVAVDALRSELAAAEKRVAELDLERTQLQNTAKTLHEWGLQLQADLKRCQEIASPGPGVTATCDAKESTLRKIHSGMCKDVSATLWRYRKLGVEPVAIIERELSTDKDTLEIVWKYKSLSLADESTAAAEPLVGTPSSLSGVKSEEVRVNAALSHAIDALNRRELHGREKGPFRNLSDAYRDQILGLVRLKVQTSISDETYHLLTQVLSEVVDLPRSYQVLEAQDVFKYLAQSDISLQKTAELKKKGRVVGSGYEANVEEALKLLLEQHVEKVGRPEKLKLRIKFEGDGLPISRQQSFCLMNVALLDSDDIHKVTGREVLACVSGKESYDLWRVCFGNVISQINALEAGPKKINVLGCEVEYEIYLGGDMKWLLCVLGLNAACAHWACLYCCVHADKRGTMSLEDLLNCPHLQRKLGEQPPEYLWKARKGRGASSESAEQAEAREAFSKFAGGASGNPFGSSPPKFGQTNEPLFNIPLKRVFICLLHALLRLTDRLEGAIIKEIQATSDLAQQENMMDEFVSCVHNIIPSSGFHVYEVPVKGTDRTTTEWTDLNGYQKKTLLQELPSHMDKFLPAESVASTRRVWAAANKMFQYMSAEKNTEADIEAYEVAAQEFLEAFSSHPSRGGGYGRANVTPYIHTLCVHVPVLLRNARDHSISCFSGTGTELMCKAARHVFQKHSNHHNPTKDVMIRLRMMKMTEVFEAPSAKERRAAQKEARDAFVAEVSDVKKRELQQDRESRSKKLRLGSKAAKKP